MKKKIISLFLAFALISSSSSEMVLAATDPSPVLDATEADLSENEHITADKITDMAVSSNNTEEADENSSQEESKTPSDVADQDTLPAATDKLQTPTLVSAANAAEGIKLVWTSVDDATGYRIYRKTDSSEWSVIGNYEPSETTGEEIDFTDKTSLVLGTYYTYTVQAYRGSYEDACLNEGNQEYWSEYNNNGIKVCMLSSPEITFSENMVSGIQIKWDAVQGASSYKVYRRSVYDPWEYLVNTSDTEFIDCGDLTIGNVYFYSIQACRDSEESCFNETGSAVRKFEIPSLSKAENTADGIKITWESVKGAEGYYVYRKTASSSWVRLGTSDSTSYVDSQNLLTGTEYIYTVRAYEGDTKSWYDRNATKSTVWVEAPLLKSAENTSSGIKISWQSVKGATSYRLYRKTAGTSWTVLADITSTSYTDKSSMKNNTQYIYTVRAYKGSDRSDYYSDGISFTNLSDPVLISAENSQGGIKITWKSVSGAEGYQVYRKTSSSSWIRIGETTSSNYTDSSSLSSGTKYIYTVRAFKGADRSWYNSSGVNEVKIDTPNLISAENSSTGITVKCSSVKGATAYRFYRKNSSGSWDVLCDTSSTSYTDKSSLSSGTQYIYTVRAYKGNDRSYFDTEGIAETKLNIPSLSSGENTSSGNVKITWKAVPNAEGYRIYRKTSNTSWTVLSTQTETSYTDTDNLEEGTSYIYTVRAYKGNDWSWYNSKGLTVTKLAIPELVKAENNPGGINVSWKNVKSASGYRIFRKTSDSSWKHIATTSSTSYTDKSALASGTKYFYTVRALSGSDLSWYDTDGIAELKLNDPVLSSGENTPTGTIKITWKAVPGAEGYRVYRKASDGEWILLAIQSGTSYTDTADLAYGSTYTYTVRAYNGSDLSWYNSKGLAVAKLSSPVLLKAENSTGGIKITWKAVKGASGYRVYRKTAGGSWARIINSTTAVSYTDKSSLSGGTKYYYTVRALKGSSLSWYNTTGVSETKLSIPSLSSAKKVTGGIKITWASVKGASGYYVYRKAPGGSWTRMASTSSTSYTHKTTSVNYIYTVRAYKGSDLSWYNSSGIRVNLNKMLSKAQSFSSSTKWLILVDTKENKVGIYYGSKNNWVQKKYWSCTTGASSSPTVKGSFTVQSKGLAFGSGYTCWYYTQFYGNYLFHSVLYNPGSKTSIQDGRLGINASHGCVRLAIENAKWIYDNIPRGTKVYIY